ncbi:MAG: SulP family inorganic anion transporter [Deltaproteobacteria bacterium]|nr:MAG: SulP family inorganic anion transporter [Deltaproteobacteria bacterium]
MSGLARIFPIAGLLGDYGRADLRGDVQAGLTVAVMIIPQAIAYGLLAGVPPQVALYASLVPMSVYLLFGTCRELSVGPAALISLMTAQAILSVAPEVEDGSQLYVSLAVLLAMMVGVVQIGLGMLRLGIMVNLLSRPVVNGFMSAAALIIAASQLSLAMGIRLPHGDFFQVLGDALRAVPQAHFPTVVLTVLSMGALFAAKRFAPKAPAAFILVVVTTLASVGLDLQGMGITIVGPVDSGLPRLALPALPSVAMLEALVPHAIAIALVGFMESISVAKTYGFKHRYDVDANRELWAVGLGNLVGGLFGAYVSTGNISRTVVSAQAGVRTQLAAGFTAFVVLLTLLWFAPAFTYLPKPALAAIIIVAVSGIVDFGEPLRLLSFRNADAAGLAITFLATLVFGVEVGIVSGIGTAIALHLYRTSDPHIATLGRVPGTTHYRDIRRHPDARIDPDLIILRIDESLYFVNAPVLKDAIEHASNEHEDVPEGIILDFIAVNDVDATALEVLEQIADELREAGTRLVIVELSGPLHDIMEASGTLDHIGEENLFHSIADAVHSFGIGPEPTQEGQLPVEFRGH